MTMMMMLVLQDCGISHHMPNFITLIADLLDEPEPMTPEYKNDTTAPNPLGVRY
jgi:hypothetical protein